MIVTWPQALFWGMSLVSIPAYCLLLFTIANGARKSSQYRTPFYFLVLSQGLADILAMLTYFVLSSVRSTRVFDEFYWDNRDFYWVMAWNYNSIYYFLFVRCFGVTIISLQRYLIICQSASRLNQLTQNLPIWVIFCIHWIPPTLYSLPITLNSDVTINSIEQMNTIVPADVLSRATLMANIFMVVTFAMCIVSYLAVLRLLLTTKSEISRAVRREVRFYVQVVGLVLAFLLITAYYIIQYTFSLTGNKEMIFTMRTFYPILSALLSYLNPWVCLLINKDLRNAVLAMLGFGTRTMQVSFVNQSLAKRTA